MHKRYRPAVMFAVLGLALVHFGVVWQATDPLCDVKSKYCSAMIPGTRSELDVAWDGGIWIGVQTYDR